MDLPPVSFTEMEQDLKEKCARYHFVVPQTLLHDDCPANCTPVSLIGSSRRLAKHPVGLAGPLLSQCCVPAIHTGHRAATGSSKRGSSTLRLSEPCSFLHSLRHISARLTPRQTPADCAISPLRSTASGGRPSFAGTATGGLRTLAVRAHSRGALAPSSILALSAHHAAPARDKQARNP